MIGTLSIALALAFLIVLLRLVLGFTANAAASSQDIGLPAHLIRARICSQADLEFVESEVPAYRSQFLRERKSLMLLCLAEVRRIAIKAFRDHLDAAGTEGSVKLTVELRLAAEYLSFHLLWVLARGLVGIANPIAAQSITASVFVIAEKLSSTAKQLGTVSPSLKYDA